MSSPRCAPREGRSSAHGRGLHGVPPTPIGMRMAQCAFKSRVLGPPQKKHPEIAPFWPPQPTLSNVVVRALVRDLPPVVPERAGAQLTEFLKIVGGLHVDMIYVGGVIGAEDVSIYRRQPIGPSLAGAVRWQRGRRCRPLPHSYMRQVSATTRGFPDIGGDPSILHRGSRYQMR